MDLKRCMNGHFYDGDSFANCPHCMGTGESAPYMAGAAQMNNNFDNNPTERFEEPIDIYSTEPAPLNQSNVTVRLKDLVDDNSKTEITSYETENDDQEKTVSYYKSVIGAEPIVGWLVCVEGNHFGEDFKLRAGKNFIGRASNMDVCLSGDASVSRERHAVVLYDPNNNIFLVQSGDSKELSYHNEKLVLSPVELHPYDLLKIGSTKLMFVPFCSDKFTWKSLDDSKNEE